MPPTDITAAMATTSITEARMILRDLLAAPQRMSASARLARAATSVTNVAAATTAVGRTSRAAPANRPTDSAGRTATGRPEPGPGPAIPDSAPNT